MIRRRHSIIGIAVPLALALSSCATSKLADQWRDPSYTEPPMKNVLVIAMKHDPKRRRMWEDGLVGPLSRHALTATPSYLRFPNALPDTQQVIEVVRSHAYDGVIVVSRLANEFQSKAVKGTTTAEPVVANSWSQRYSTYWVVQQQPGYIENERVVRHQVELWTTNGGGRLVWTAIGRSVDPGSTEQVKRELANSVVPELAKQKLIPPQAK